jgi:hypothetical protein
MDNHHIHKRIGAMGDEHEKQPIGPHSIDTKDHAPRQDPPASSCISLVIIIIVWAGYGTWLVLPRLLCFVPYGLWNTYFSKPGE